MPKQKTKAKENPYFPKPYKIIDFHRETIDDFTITVNMKIKHEPGQFVQVSIPGIGEAPISICSYSEKFIKLNVREIGNVTKSLSKLKKGDTILVRGPYGKGYPMELLKGNNILIIGGGCGVAPLKSVIDYVECRRKDYKDLTLFLAYHSPENIVFRKEIEEWEKKYNVTLTIDKNVHSHICYDIKEGLVTDALRRSNLNNENKVVFICGPPLMMKYSIEILKQEGFNDSQIFISAERFMYCGIGICCHCMIRGKYTCIDGPVFRYDEIKDLKND